MSRYNIRAKAAILDMLPKVCFYCKCETTDEKATLDHMIPKMIVDVTAGNCVLSCEKCNYSKGSKPPSREMVLDFLRLMLNISDKDYRYRKVYSRINDIYDDFIDYQVIIGTLQLLTFEHVYHPAIVTNKVI
jgi:hypothetical protein